MADRSLYSHLSGPAPNGMLFMEQYADRLGQLFTAAIWPLGSVGGTGDAVTAACDPPLLPGIGLIEHMRFAITWAAANSGDMTLSIAGGTPVPVLASDASAMAAGAAKPGTRALLEYVGGAFIIINSTNDGLIAPYHVDITASTTWLKPGGYADDAMVLLRAWGGGGGGARNTSGSNAGGGGGGGGYVERWMRYADVPSSLSITIGAGGAASGGSPGGVGGNTTVGALLTAYGGAGGVTGAASEYGIGGVGGGELNSGAAGGNPGGGTAGQPARTIWGGSGGGNNGTNGSGGGAVYGGGGGGSGHANAGATLGQGGVSLFGGNGGTGGRFNNISGTPGTAPGGGGGGAYTASAAAGARGEVRITIFG